MDAKGGSSTNGGAGAGGRVSVLVTESINYRGGIYIMGGGSNWDIGGTGTAFIEKPIRDEDDIKTGTYHTTLILDNYVSNRQKFGLVKNNIIKH